MHISLRTYSNFVEVDYLVTGVCLLVLIYSFYFQCLSGYRIPQLWQTQATPCETMKVLGHIIPSHAQTPCTKSLPTALFTKYFQKQYFEKLNISSRIPPIQTGIPNEEVVSLQFHKEIYW